MYNAALVLPYFGKLPNYFQLWLRSAGKNTTFDWFVFCDSDIGQYDIPDNVRIIHMSFDGNCSEPLALSSYIGGY